MHAFIFIGRSGCGKGTQAELLKQYIAKKDPTSILYIETGENFRQFIKGEKYTNQLSRKVYEGDELQPSFLAAYMWMSEVIERYTGHEHIIFDGTPRSLDEAQIITGAFRFYRIEKPIVVHLNVSREWSKKHLLSRGRFDDSNEKRIEKRLDWFDSDVLPAIDYYRNHTGYTFLEISGEQPVDKVHSDIISSLKPILFP